MTSATEQRGLGATLGGIGHLINANEVLGTHSQFTATKRGDQKLMPSQPLTCSCRSPANACWTALRRDLAEAEHIDVARHPYHAAHVMIDEQDRRAFLGEELDPLIHLLGNSWSKPDRSARR